MEAMAKGIALTLFLFGKRKTGAKRKRGNEKAVGKGGKSSESVTAHSTWLESESDKRGKERMKEMVEKTEAKNARVKVLINEKEIKIEKLLYSLS